MITRYQKKEMGTIWSEEHKFNTWLKVEKLTAEAFSQLGEIPKEDIEKINKDAVVNVERIYELEQELKHDVVAFTRAVSESLGKEKKWIHFGLTSTDVVDTAQGRILKEANDLIEEALLEFINIVKLKAQKYKYTIEMGRTHGVHAELTTFGYKMAIFYDELQRNLTRFRLAREQIEVGIISGAVGTYANVDPYVQDYVCEHLKINSSKISTQTLQRDRHAFYISVIAIMGDTLDKMAIEFRNLQRTEIREVEENFSKNQKGSSAMPHKKNPISSENISGLARLLRGYTVAAHENVGLYHERDISHSSAERIILPDATSLIHYMLVRFKGVVANLGVNEQKMLDNISLTNNVFFSQRILLKLIEKGLTREESYDLVQPIALEAFNENKDFKFLVQERLFDKLSEKEIEDGFKTDYHLKNIDMVFERLGLN